MILIRNTRSVEAYVFKCTHTSCCGDEDLCTKRMECQGSGHWDKNLLVTDGILVFVETKFPYTESLLFVHNDRTLRLTSDGINIKWTGKFIIPIIISEIEKIEVGDFGYNKTHGIVKVTNLLWAQQEGLLKVIALPEHFSPQHLEAIKTGKIKEGPVILECQKKTVKTYFDQINKLWTSEVSCVSLIDGVDNREFVNIITETKGRLSKSLTLQEEIVDLKLLLARSEAEIQRLKEDRKIAYDLIASSTTAFENQIQELKTQNKKMSNALAKIAEDILNKYKK